MTEQFFTKDQVKDLLRETLTEALPAALKAANPVDPADRPAAVKAPAAPAFNRGRYPLPELGAAMKALYAGQFRQSTAFERDFSQAAKSLWKYDNSDAAADEKDPPLDGEPRDGWKNSRSIIWPKSSQEMRDVLYAMGEPKHADMIDRAVKAMAEGTAGTSGLVPTQYAQDRFAYALTSTVAVRQVPGIETMPVVSNLINLPKETTAAGGSTALEAGTLSAQDATLGTQTITVKKQYGYRLYSNELLADATPAWMEFLANTLVRDVALVQDLQFLEGSGSTSNIQGLVGYTGLTTGPSLGTNGRTPTLDDFYQAQYLLRLVNAEPDFVIAHPRVINSLAQIKDSTGNYILSAEGGINAPASFGTGLPGAGPKAVLLRGTLPVWFSSQINIARTVGSSTDCTTVLIGNSRNVLILERQGIEVAYSEHIAFNTDQSAARAIARSAIAILQPTAVATIAGVRP